MTRRLATLLVAATLALTSCASLTPESLPITGDRNGYDVTLEFASVLNLANRAQVVLDGVPVGVVTGMRLTGAAVRVTVRLDEGVVAPGDIEAVLRQPTVLGDIVVALVRSPDADPAAPPLGPGDVVPLSRTTSPPQIEDTIASLANFVASGAVQRAQNSLIEVNSVVEASDVDLSDIAARVSVNLGDLADNLASVDLALTGLSSTARTLSGKRGAIADWFSPAGMLGFDRATQVGSRLSVMIPSIGSVYTGGFWLVPMLRNLGDAAGAVQASKWAVGDEIPEWWTLFTEYFLPQDRYPAIDITSIRTPDGRELSHSVSDVLRMLGATP